jgi:hypothetical protein
MSSMPAPSIGTYQPGMMECAHCNACVQRFFRRFKAAAELIDQVFDVTVDIGSPDPAQPFTKKAKPSWRSTTIDGADESAPDWGGIIEAVLIIVTKGKGRIDLDGLGADSLAEVMEMIIKVSGAEQLLAQCISDQCKKRKNPRNRPCEERQGVKLISEVGGSVGSATSHAKSR